MKLHIGSYTLPILREGYSWNENCGENGSHATSSVSCSVRPQTGLLTYLMTAEGNLEAVIKSDEGNTLFTGVVRPYTGTSFEGGFQDSISLEIMDYTETLHIYIYPETDDGQVSGAIYPQVWKGKTLGEIVSILFSLGGKTVNFSSSESLPYFKLEGKQYLDNVIAELLYEYGLDYKWTAGGTAEIFSTFVDGETVGTITDVRNNFDINRSDDTTDGLKVTWKEYEYRTNIQLYSFDSGNQTFNSGWEFEVLSTKGLKGKLYSGIMHDQHFNSNKSMPVGNLWTWNFPSSEIKKDDVLFVETDVSKISISLFDEADDVSFYPTLESYDVNGMRMWVNYDGNFGVQFGKGWTWRISVRGNAGVATGSEASYNIVGGNPDTKELKYRLGLKGAAVISENLVRQLYLRTKYSKIVYIFNSLTSYTIGGFYTVEGNTVRIIGKTQNENGIYSYRCEGCKPYSVVTISVTTEQSGNNKGTSSKSAYDIAVDNGYTGSETEWLETLEGVSTALLYLYKRSGETPNNFDGAEIVYTYATGVMTGSFGTWSTAIPTGNEALYFIMCRVTGKGDDYTVTTGEWSTPALMSESGSKGADGKTAVVLILYQRGKTAPATPTNTVTYNFGNAEVTGTGDWGSEIPDGTLPLWATQACAIGNGESDSITPSEWTTPKKIMENGVSPIQIGLSLESYIFPSDEDGIIKRDDYLAFSSDVLLVQGGATLDFTLTVAGTGITWVTTEGKTVKLTKDSVMLGDTASIKVTATYDGGSISKTITLAKAKAGKDAMLYFAWSKSESEFIPRDSSFFMWGSAFGFFNGGMMGSLPLLQWSTNREKIEELKDSEYCYLWAKLTESGVPFLFTGKQGIKGLTGQYVMYQYAVGEDDATVPSDGDFSDSMPSLTGDNAGKYLWMRNKVVPSGGNPDDVEWNTPVIAGSDSSEIYAKISDTETQITEITKAGGIIETRISEYKPDGENTISSLITQTQDSIALRVVGSEGGVKDKDGNVITGINIKDGTIQLNAEKTLINGSVTADKIDVADLMTQELIIGAGGAIESQSHRDDNSKGFKLWDSGHIDANDITLGEDIVFGGELQNDVIKTVKKLTPSTEITSPSYSEGEYWSTTELYNLLNSITGPFTGSYNGSAERTQLYKEVVNPGLGQPKYIRLYYTELEWGLHGSIYDWKEVKYSWLIVSQGNYWNSSLLLKKDDSVIVQCGSSYTSWIGVTTKYAPWPGTGLSGLVSSIILSGSYNGVNVAGYNITATSSTIIIRGLFSATQGEYFSEDTWPSYSITPSSDLLGVYATDIFPFTDSSGDYIGKGDIGSLTKPFNELWGTKLCNIYPIGSVYLSASEVTPDVFLGGTWVKQGNSTIGGITVYVYKRTE